MAKLISLILNSAGAKTTQQEVFDCIFATDDFSPIQAKELCLYIFSGIFPVPKKKDSQQVKKQAK